MTIIAAILIFGVLIFVHEFGHFTTAKLFGVKVHEFAIGMGPAIFKRKKGETDYSLRILPIGGYVKLEGEDFASDDERAFNKCPPLKRIIILASGAFMNVLTGFLLFVLIFSFAAQIPSTVIEKVYEGTPAAEAGILAGDRIRSINGKRVNIYSDISFTLFEDDGKDAQIEIDRGTERMTFNLTPAKDGERSIIGIYPVLESPGVGTVLRNAYYNTFFVVRVVIVSLKMLITGQVGVSEMSGPVGIVGEIGQAAKSGILDVLNFAALIAVNLGVMNMLPLPALDGGRIFFILLELIFGKPVSPKIEGYIHAIGLVILLLLMLVITYSDIMKLVT
ncbi:MAG: RIP metalloprotease RseP [Clostridia bacterium]|nr:RIP metalloprotease RseP [Clostridia bacterium]